MSMTRRHKGFTLIELMVAIVIGMIMLAAITAVTVKSISASSYALKMTRLEQELNAIMTLMIRDIRRSGFSGTVPAGDEFLAIGLEDMDSDGRDDCVVFAYDRNEDGTLDDDERQGFRWDQANSAVEVRSTSTAAACDQGTWNDVSDTQTVEITELTFDNSSSFCISAVNGRVDVREITITLTGQLEAPGVHDSAARNLVRTVRARNDRYRDGVACP